MYGLTDWLDFLYGNIIWPCLLMCEVPSNFSKYNHPNQPTYPKISKKRSYKNIPQNFLKFCMNNHPTLGQILGKLYGDHVITLAVIAQNIFSRHQKHKIDRRFFIGLPVMTTLNNSQWAVLRINITYSKFHADISYRLKDINILNNYESRNRAAIFHPRAVRNLVSLT